MDWPSRPKTHRVNDIIEVGNYTFLPASPPRNCLAFDWDYSHPGLPANLPRIRRTHVVSHSTYSLYWSSYKSIFNPYSIELRTASGQGGIVQHTHQRAKFALGSSMPSPPAACLIPPPSLVMLCNIPAVTHSCDSLKNINDHGPHCPLRPQHPVPG